MMVNMIINVAGIKIARTHFSAALKLWFSHSKKKCYEADVNFPNPRKRMMGA
jgi:hypothetical protein